MEVECGRNVREEVNFPRAAQSLEGKGKARKHRFLLARDASSSTGNDLQRPQGYDEEMLSQHSATKRMRIGDDGEPKSIICFLT